jgi:hypothetical protein
LVEVVLEELAVKMALLTLEAVVEDLITLE